MNQNKRKVNNEHILVCISSAVSNLKIIRTAAKMANAFDCPLTALFIETPDFSATDESAGSRLRQNIKTAQDLGARIEIIGGDDIPYQIAEFSRLSGVTKIVIGRSAAARSRIIRKASITDKLIEYAPNIDIHIIPDTDIIPEYKTLKARSHSFSAYDLTVSIAVLIAATLIGYAFRQLGFTEANIITVYLLGVLLISIFTAHRLCSLISSAVSVILFNFFFTDPNFTLKAYSSGYPATFIIMFTAAFIASSIAIKMKTNSMQYAQSALRTKILFDTNQMLQKAHGKDEIINAAAAQLTKLLNKNIFIYSCENGSPENLYVYSIGKDKKEVEKLAASEEHIIKWVIENNHQAGSTSKIFPDAKCLCLAIRVNDNVYGAVGIELNGEPPDSFENSVMLSILGECAITLENEKNAREKEKAAVLAKDEQLRANLLRAISHDLRTPLTSISGNADNLISNGDSFDSNTKMQIYRDIYDDSIWLINLVENLLYVTRLQDGRMKLNLSDELIDEIISEALNHINNRDSSHKINFAASDDIVFVTADVRLIIQVIINIVDNALKYTPDGSEITIKTERRKNNMLFVIISDNGPGISDEAKEKVFDMFYSGSSKIADSRRSIGLGLSLCKSIISAHGGEIFVSDNKPHGAIFTFSLPVKELEINE